MAEPKQNPIGAAVHWLRGRPLAVFAAGVVAAGAVAGLCGLSVVEFGLFDTSATEPHNALISWATHDTFVRATELRARNIKAPAHFTGTQVQAGFRQYRADCEACHGGPGVARALWVKGLTPTPPFLMDSRYRWTTPELYWIVDNGAKMTAMPAWGLSRSQEQVWDLVAFLDTMADLSPAQYAQMAAAQPPAPGPTAGGLAR